MRPHMARLQLAWKDFKQIMKSCKSRRFGNVERPPPTPGPMELKDIVVVKKDHKKDAQGSELVHFGAWDHGRNAHHSPGGSPRIGAKT